MLIESIQLSKLAFDPSNARKHNPKNIDAIKGSLAKFGQQKPIVVDGNGVVVAGNGTLVAAKDLGWDKIDAVRTTLTGPEAIAFALADNRTAELAEWDLDNMGPILKSLQDINFDLGAIGFDEKDLAKLMPEESKAGLCDDDEVPEVTETRCKVGDLWQLGNHRLLCGDSTNVLHVERLMGGEKADMVFTDPPYGMNLDTDYSKMPGTSTKYKSIAGDNEPFDAGAMMQLVKAPVWYIWGADYFCHSIKSWNEGSIIVWAKAHSEEENKVFGSSFEICWRYPKAKKEVWFTRRIQMTGERLGEHPTQKPTDLAVRAIEKDSKKNNILLDLFLGSGSTLIACEKTNRKCFGMEIDPHYCDVILARWEKFTGKSAIQINEEISG